MDIINKFTTFDLYCWEVEQGRQQLPDNLRSDNLKVGARVWMDGIDGFYDQYFEGVKKAGIKKIRFVTIARGISSIPHDSEAFEKMPFVEAEIIDNRETYAQVLITSVKTLGEWIRITPLSEAENIKLLPIDLQPPAEIISGLLVEAQESGSALWVSNVKFWKSLSEISAVYVFKHDKKMRCAIVMTYATSSVLVYYGARIPYGKPRG